MIKETYESHAKGKCINLLLRLINMGPGKNANVDVESNKMIKVIFNEIMGIKSQLNKQSNYNNYLNKMSMSNIKKFERINIYESVQFISNKYRELLKLKDSISTEVYNKRLEELIRDINNLIVNAKKLDLADKSIITAKLQKIKTEVEFELLDILEIELNDIEFNDNKVNNL